MSNYNKMISFLYYKISGTSSLGDYFIENMEAQTETSSAFHQIKYLDTPLSILHIKN